MAGGCGMALEEHALWPVQSQLTAGRHEEEEESRSTLKDTVFEDRQQEKNQETAQNWDSMTALTPISFISLCRIQSLPEQFMLRKKVNPVIDLKWSTIKDSIQKFTWKKPPQKTVFHWLAGISKSLSDLLWLKTGIKTRALHLVIKGIKCLHESRAATIKCQLLN